MKIRFAAKRLGAASAAAAAIVLLATASGAQAAPIVANGSFEDLTNFAANANGQDTVSLPPNSTLMDGWTVGPSHNVAWIGPTNPFGLTAQDGDYFLDLTDYTDGFPYGGLSQTIATVAGHQYQLSFYLGANSGSAVDVTVGTSTQNFTNSIAGSNTWQQGLLSFFATGSSTLLSFQGSAGGAYIGLDNVAVVATGVVSATPIPGSILMLGTALAGLGFAGWRRGTSTATGALRAI
jgi:Protein of unknown function (DUF642)